MDSPRNARGARFYRWVPGALGVLAAGYMAWYLDRGWIPIDLGTLSQSAERVLEGQLPHRDFVDVYTGGLSTLHGLTFRALGTDAVHLRWILYAGFLPWLMALFWIARRLASPILAVMAVAAAITWSVPNYPEAMPSWYNLFLATFMVAALIRFAETERWGWLALAGLAGGAAVLVKINGAFLVAGGATYLVYHEQSTLADGERAAPEAGAVASTEAGGATATPRAAGAGHVYSALLALTGLLAWLALWRLLGGRPSGREVVHYLVPFGALAAFLVWSSGRARAPVTLRLHRLLRMALPYLSGVALPVGVLLAVYAYHGAVDDLIQGVIVLPLMRLGGATQPLESLLGLLLSVPAALFLVWTSRLDDASRGRIARLAAAALLPVLWLGSEQPIYRSIWIAARTLMPLALCVAILLLSRRVRDGRQDVSTARTAFAVISISACASLIQHPYAAPIYFLYVAPLAILVALAALALGRGGSRPVAVVGLAFLALFGARWNNTGVILRTGWSYEARPPMARSGLERATLRIPVDDGETYRELVSLVAARADGGVLYAGPDAPEVPFLAGLPSGTASPFDFFLPGASPEVDLPTLDGAGAPVIVENLRPAFSPTWSTSSRGYVDRRYPNRRDVGHFRVRWR